MRKNNVSKLINSLSNRGRWGRNDELGTLNFITAEKISKAAMLVVDGVSVSCSRSISTSPCPDLKSEAMRGIADSSEFRTIDFIGMIFHGRSITHIDAPPHFFWRGKTYNGFPAAGAKFCDAEVLKNGIVTKGVLLNIPGRLARPADLEYAEKKAGVKIESGDALLVRTGEGFDPSSAAWLKKRQVAVVGSDTPNDAPFFHHLCLSSMGLWILDNCDLENLYKTCKKKKRWDFFMIISSLRLKNVTGSPVNPIAVF